MSKKEQLWVVVLMLAATFFPLPAKAQVTIGELVEPDMNAVLELRSNGNKGLLLPRVVLTDTLSVAPLTAPVPKGMMVYNTTASADDKVVEGIYFWDGRRWWPANGENSQPWLVAGSTKKATQNNENIYQMGNVGIGTANPTAKMEINSGTGDVSGLKLTNLNGNTPVSAGGTLGVDANGNVVTVVGNAFLPNYMQSFAGGTVDLYIETPNYNLANIVITVKGTYLITYQVSAQTVNTVSGGTGAPANFCSAFISTGASAATTIPNSQILVYKGRGSTTSDIFGGTGTGVMVITVAEAELPRVFYLGAIALNARARAYNDDYSHTSIAAIKITP